MILKAQEVYFVLHTSTIRKDEDDMRAQIHQLNHKTADRDCARHMSEPRCPGGFNGHY